MVSPSVNLCQITDWVIWACVGYKLVFLGGAKVVLVPSATGRAEQSLPCTDLFYGSKYPVTEVSELVGAKELAYRDEKKAPLNLRTSQKLSAPAPESENLSAPSIIEYNEVNNVNPILKKTGQKVSLIIISAV